MGRIKNMTAEVKAAWAGVEKEKNTEREGVG